MASEPPAPPAPKTGVEKALLPEQPTKSDQLVEELQEALTQERDARREDRFIFIAVGVVLLDIMLFSVMPSFGGPLAILVLQLMILLPLAQRMGMEDVAQIISGVLGRLADGVGSNGKK